MKRKSTHTLVALLSIILLINESYSQSFYDINTIQKIEMTFTQTNWDYMLDTAKAGSEGYIMAQSVTINGVQFDSVGVKYKGNSTYNAAQVKNPFHIELDTYKDQDYNGYTDIKLSNAAKDPSFVREVLSYSILRQYMDAPLSNYTNVYINNKLIGLYISAESVGKKFVDAHFYSKDNAFFKCNPIDGARPGTSDLPNLMYLGADSAKYTSAYEINSDAGWKDLIDLCNTLNNNTNAIETVLDVDRALWMLAFDNAIVNLDSYIGQFAQNYYLYKDNTGRFNCVLWDFNESFGTFGMSGTINFQSTASKSQMTHLLHADDANWPLVQKLLAVPSYKKMYLAHLHTILNENFANNSYLTTAQALQSTINTAVQADPNKYFTYAQYQNNLTTDVTSGNGGPGTTSAPGISNLMSGRNTYLSALPDFVNTKPTITNIAPSNTNPELKSNVTITANVVNTNANAVYLGYRYSVKDKFTKTLMYDDGTHGDGASGDNVYGVSIEVSKTTVQYYIYAENNNAGRFSPERAEHEFYSLKAAAISGDITMNEIYARGTSAAPDWIEIYNSTSAAIDISGYKIYDSGGQSASKPKKVFPTGTVIAAKGFFVIITDDAEASGFGLSNSGEKVWLENASGVIIDSVKFAEHTAVESYGRIPDGGNWQTLTAITRGTSNNSSSDVEDKLLSLNNIGFKTFPNPFNTTTAIQFTLPKSENATLTVYNSIGQLVTTLVNGKLNFGLHTYQWNAENYPTGLYFCRLEIENQTLTQKMIVIK